jgi:hypothetical protein
MLDMPSVGSPRVIPGVGPSRPGLVELASGVDALYVSGRGVVSPRFLTELEGAKQRAQASDTGVAIDVDGHAATVEPRAFGRYPFLLSTEHGRIGVTDSTSLPALRIQPLAEHLHAVGPRASLAWFEDLAASFTDDLRLSASRLDVFSDWHGLVLDADDRHRFVGRAKRLDTHEDAGALTGFEFGRRKTQTVAARIYDKSLDMKTKGALWWPQVWGDAYEPGRQVVRVEVEFGRKGLTQYGVDTALQALDAAPDLWLTATTDWLSLRAPSGDATRSRWPVDTDWLTIQRPTFAEHAIGLDRVLDGRSQGLLRMLLPGLVGYLASFCALVGASNLDDALGELLAHVADYGIISGTTFEQRIIDKRAQFRSARVRHVPITRVAT